MTPFRADGALDEPALRALVEWQIGSVAPASPAVPVAPFHEGSSPYDQGRSASTRVGSPAEAFPASPETPSSRQPGDSLLTRHPLPAGVDWLVACGTTGETPTLSRTEWEQVLRIVAAAAAGRVPVWAGCSSNSTREAVERAAWAAAVPGITAVLTANPFYNKPGQEGQYQHFLAIAAAVAPFPVVLYNIPGRTGVNLEPATVARLAHAADNIVGIKESSGNLPQITELLTLVPRSFRVYAGDDAMALGVLGVGGAGLVSVASNAIPRELTALVHAAIANEWAHARSLNQHYFPLLLASFLEPSPGPIKALLAMMGRIHETYRLPMMPVADATRARLHALAAELDLLPPPSRAERVDLVEAPVRA